MIKQIMYSSLYAIIMMVFCFIGNQLVGNLTWFRDSLMMGIGTFTGVFIGYGLKYETTAKDAKNANE